MVDSSILENFPVPFERRILIEALSDTKKCANMRILTKDFNQKVRV